MDNRLKSSASDAPTLRDEASLEDGIATIPKHGVAAPPVSNNARDPYIGAVIDGRYVVEQMLGQGGMGVVYLGRHKVIDKRVAIKILRGQLAGEKDLVQRFLNEARAASSVGNPHIVDITDFGQLPDGATYFAMEFLDGQSLAARIADRRALPLHEIAHITRQIAEGLHAAHEAGIVHRDLKPDNVMLLRRGEDQSFVKILDFGIAKTSGEAKKLTVAGHVFGTPHYMSPEQAEGSPVDRRSDIYSLGVLMYEMTVGRVPFDGENMMGILSQHLHKAPDSARSLRTDIPSELDAIISRCMEKKPAKRFQSMNDVMNEIDKAAHAIALRPRSLTIDSPSAASWADKSGAISARDIAGGAARLPRFVFVALGITAILCVAAVVIYVAKRAKISPIVASTDPSAEIHLAQPSALASNPLAIAPPIELTIVTITTIPADAKISRGEIEVGRAPQDLSVGNNETAQVTVSKDGYASQTIAVDASNPRIEVQLKKLTRDTQVSARPAVGSNSAAAKPKCPPNERYIVDRCTRF